jgi:hypothetical protein
MLQNNGIEGITTAIANSLDEGQFGSDSSPLTPADGGVLSPIAATLLSLDLVNVSGRTISAKHAVDSLTGNGETFAEHEIVLSTGESLTRNLVVPFIKTNTIEVNIFTIFTISPAN